MEKEDVSKRVERMRTVQEGRSYAEAARKTMHQKSKEDKRINLTWTTAREEYEWLSRSAIGVLRSFSSMEGVNQKLEDRGFGFTSTILGGKDIIWTFETSCDRDGFVNNSFFWKECYSTMKAWGGQNRMPSSSKLCWVDVHGVPLICWCKAFFKSLGDLVGETLWIDEETERRKRLDVGKILISTPIGESLTREVEVIVGGRSFPVKMVEQTTQISIGWLSNHLKVKPYGSNLNNCVNKDDFGLFSEKTSREACLVEDSGSDRCREGVEKDVSNLIRVEKKFRKAVREQVSKNIRQNGEATFGSGVGKEKGKSVWIPSRKTIIQAPGGNGSIRFKSQSGLYGGKRRWKDSGPSFGLCGDGLHGVIGEDSGLQKYRKGLGQSVEARKVLTALNQVYDSLPDDNVEEMESEATQSTFGGKEELSIQVVPETQFCPDRGIKLMVDLREKGDCGEEQISGREKMTMEELIGQGKEDHQRKEGDQPTSDKSRSGESKMLSMKKSRGKKNSSSIKIHPMITRGLKGYSDKGFKEDEIVEYLSLREKEDEGREEE
ncbi:hypothetical protein Q3G72_026742 [Acer saccharum]|nr:hypothetical protein Q3G72_026742 [Acer saccharum]